MLSIGLRVPASSAPPLDEAAAPAQLEGAGRTWPLDREVVSIGRHVSATIHLADPQVSSRHAEIVHHDGARWLRDSGSRNGTWVNAHRVTVPHALREGDALRIGATDFVFHGAGPRRFAHQGAPGPTAPDEPQAFVLEVRAGPLSGLRFALTGAQVTLGRDPASDLVLEHPSISRRHAVLAEHRGRWFVSDLHSAAGTYKNGARVAAAEETPLDDGDTLKIGAVVLVFTR
jgi:putative serine protease PepD